MDPAHSVTALADLAQVPPDRVRTLERLGLIGTGHGSFSSGDVHRIRLVDAFEAAGVPAAALAGAPRAAQPGRDKLLSGRR
jgi:DNA-binding transcriptional MerR regulator